MDKIQGDDPIESKAIIFDEIDGPGSYPMILTAFEEENNEALDRAGYRGRYVLFTLIDGGPQDSFTDPYSGNPGLVTAQLKDFCIAVRRGWETHGQEGINWSDLEHGGRYDKTVFNGIA